MKRLYWATGFVWIGAMLGLAGCLAAMRYGNLWLILAGSLVGVVLGIVPAVLLLRGYVGVDVAGDNDSTGPDAQTPEPEATVSEPAVPVSVTPMPVQGVPVKQFANRWEALELRGLEVQP